MTKANLIIKKFFGKMPAKIIPFNMRHLTYWDSYVFYSLDPAWWRDRKKRNKKHLVKN